MATARNQRKWRGKHRLVKRQLNVMARMKVHEYLGDFSRAFNLKGKGEAVTFACFVTQALVQRADYSGEAAKMLSDFSAAYHRDREIYTT
ncbi:MAG: hypothetical protein EXQ86_04900 [Rhodospirillales bacterium]|nr:hypothetical protein [Rhodospirillales bacterium]